MYDQVDRIVLLVKVKLVSLLVKLPEWNRLIVQKHFGGDQHETSVIQQGASYPLTINSAKYKVV